MCLYSIKQDPSDAEIRIHESPISALFLFLQRISKFSELIWSSAPILAATMKRSVAFHLGTVLHGASHLGHDPNQVSASPKLHFCME